MNTQEIVGAENRYILHNVSWDTYESLLEDFTDCAAQNFTYTNEILEIMSSSRKHEKIAELLSEIVKSSAYHDGIRFDSDRASTLKRNDLEKGAEPDASFYIQSEPLVRNKIELDLTKDPPPDLIIEVDITSPSINKLDIYRELRIPEIWFYNDKKASRFFT